MGIETCDGILFRKLFIGGVRWVAFHRDRLNDINVYPVPDGDTGTNFYLTLRGALAACTVVQGTSLGNALKIISRGALLNARGNSGVILSQIIAGFSQYFKKRDVLLVEDLAPAFQCAAERAYKSVAEPREGTVLTVVRVLAERLKEHTFEKPELLEALEYVYREADEILTSCKDLLPVLKKSNVVDAGGQGLVFLLEGMLRAARFENIERQLLQGIHIDAVRNTDYQHLENRYCLEFIVQGCMEDIGVVRGTLEPMGNSLVAATIETLLKVHLHTNHPDHVRSYVATLGEIIHEKRDDMQKQHRELLFRDEIKTAGDQFSVVFQDAQPVPAESPLSS